MTISYSYQTICRLAKVLSNATSCLNPVEFIRSPPLESRRENDDHLECNWRDGATLPLNAFSAVFWCEGGLRWKRKNRGKRKREDEVGYRLARNERGDGLGMRARRERDRTGMKKIRRKAGLIRALVAPSPPPELIDCMESEGEGRVAEGFPAFLLSHTRRETALARFLPTDKLASARLPRVINRRIAFIWG